jgi:hypothetical protein
MTVEETFLVRHSFVMQPGAEVMSWRPSNSQNMTFYAGQGILALSVITLLLSGAALGQSTLSAAEAKNHIGQKATVCGKVAGTYYGARSLNDPTFINLDKPHSTQVFKVVIWGTERSKFGNPEIDYQGKRICVTGEIAEFKRIPQIVATNPSQIRIQ